MPYSPAQPRVPAGVPEGGEWTRGTFFHDAAQWTHPGTGQKRVYLNNHDAGYGAKVWIEEGKEVLSKDKWDVWEEIVPIRLKDLYRGMELRCCLDIVKVLNNGTLEEAKILIEKQNHSGMSFGLVCSMVREFSPRGIEFVDFVR